jgi:hypothetical protein
MFRMRRDLPLNNTLWALLGYVVNLEAETRVIREEDRGVRNGLEGMDVGDGAPVNVPGGAAAYRRWRMRNNLKNLILHREEYEPYDYLCRVSHIDPW